MRIRLTLDIERRSRTVSVPEVVEYSQAHLERAEPIGFRVDG